MTLDTVANAALAEVGRIGKNYREISRIRGLLDENSTNSDVLFEYLRYNPEKDPVPLSETESQIMAKDYMATPMILDKDVKQASREGTDALINATKEGYETVVGALDEAHLQHVAMEIPNETKSFLALDVAINAGNEQKAIEIYASTSKNKAWQEFLRKYGDSAFVQRHRAFFVESERRKYMEEHFFVEENRDGKKVKVFSPEKARAYLLASPGKLKDNEHLAYLKVGETYTLQILAKEAEKKKK